ncbi:transposase [Streptomyces triculaminicus]|uniref:transposase n=1 Tax=Streptomyces triculaminicus TaxID=2816232 RepID=UPI0037D357DB
MRLGKVEQLRSELAGFVAHVFASLPRRDRRRCGECYLRGLMLDGWRKSIQPMAERLPDGNMQALQQFVNQSPWDWLPVRRRIADPLAEAITPEVWVVDDVSFFVPAVNSGAVDEVFYKGAHSASKSGFEGSTRTARLWPTGCVPTTSAISTSWASPPTTGVKATALDGARAGFAVRVLLDYTAGVAADTTSMALSELRRAGVTLSGEPVALA